MRKIALTIAGSDPSGGAGIQADLKTFHQYGVYGQAVITLVTVQNTFSVSRVEVLRPDVVSEQISALIADVPPHAAKTGALGDVRVIEAVATEARRFDFPLVVDPVMISKHRTSLMSEDARAAMREMLLPLATVVTPNLHEAAELSGLTVESLDDMKRAAERLCELGCKAVLVKGGHLAGCATDVLFSDGEFDEFSSKRIDTAHTHGTGCTFSAAITANLATGLSLIEAIADAKIFITKAIQTNPGLGQGSGPVNHFA